MGKARPQLFQFLYLELRGWDFGRWEARLDNVGNLPPARRSMLAI
jgi:hypothetical protein